MLKKHISTIVLFLFLLFVIAIDIPQNTRIYFQKGPFKIDKVINPIEIDINIFGIRIKKQFSTHLGLDLKGGSHLVFEADMRKVSPQEKSNAIEGARNIIERRVNYFGISEPEIRTIKSGSSYRISVDLPGVKNVAQAVSLIGQTAQLDFREIATDDAKIATSTPISLLLRKSTGITGKHVKEARTDFSQQTGEPVVLLKFNSKGAELFEKVTERNVGKPIGIFLDNILISYPTVQEVITGGDAVISGRFTFAQAKQLAIAINSGALPISIKLVEQRNIGPTLGKEQVEKSIFAGMVGLFAVILFMILYYQKLGLIASVALCIYGLISLAIFRAIPVVLTLPGIAGFILSIGMAVDSNILIFERIKEEMRKGKDFELAQQLGFGRAIDAIKDANITTLIVAFILFNPFNWSFLPQFGMVRGFALTLAIGVATSLFTGVFITKKLIKIVYRNKRL